MKIIVLLTITVLLLIWLYLDKKLNDKKLSIKLILILTLSFLIYDFTSALTGEFITKPLLNKLYPPIPDVLVEPIYSPIISEGKEYIRVNYKNMGETPLTEIFIEKRYAENLLSKGDKYYEPVSVSTRYLPIKGDQGYFEFLPPNQNISCKMREPITIKTFVDRRGIYYQKNDDFKEGCFFVPLRIRFYSKEINRTYDFLYPIRTYYSFNLYLNGAYLYPYDQAPNKEELQEYRTFQNCSLIEYSAYCGKGFLEKEVCFTKGKVSQNPKLICISEGQEYAFEFPILKTPQ